jgi:hypothetical protein
MPPSLQLSVGTSQTTVHPSPVQAQVAPLEHVTVQPAPRQVQSVPAPEQLMAQSVPVHSKSQVRPALQLMSQRSPHSRSHSPAPEQEVWQPPAGQMVVQRPLEEQECAHWPPPQSRAQFAVPLQA